MLKYFLLISILIVGLQAETYEEAGERSGSILSSVKSMEALHVDTVTNLNTLQNGNSYVITWSIISYLDIDSNLVITLPNESQQILVGERSSRVQAGYRIGDTYSYKHTFSTTIDLTDYAGTGDATVGFYTYRHNDDAKKGMFALIPVGVIERPYGIQGKQFYINIVDLILSASDLNFPSTGIDWNFTAGSPFHDTQNYADNTFDDTFAYDLNKDYDLDSGLNVHPIADGTVILANATLGFRLVEHSTPLRLDNGTILNTWYSGYMHMNNRIANNTDVTITSTLGDISDEGTENNHLHFAIYTLNDTTYTSIDIANQLSDLVSDIDTWVEWCGDARFPPTHTLNSSWWGIGETPCPYLQ